MIGGLLNKLSGGDSSSGGRADSGGVSVADTVDRLIDRVEMTTLLDDRRDAVKALKSLAKKYRMEVGGRGMDVVVDLLKNEQGNPEICQLGLETLCYVIGEDEDGPVGTEENPDELGQQFAEIFIKRPEPVSTVLETLEEYNFGVRRGGLRLLTGLLRHRPDDLQDILLKDPSAIPRLLDLLQETREVLRNDAILMMCELTRGNPHIQKLVAFENAFQILLNIISFEGEQSIVVEDCLYCILNLLKNNPSNQTLFREHSLIQHLCKLFHSLMNNDDDEQERDQDVQPTNNDDDQSWTTQKIANILLLLQVIRSLVSPTNPQELLKTAQAIMHKSGLLQELCEVLIQTGVPAEILTEAIRTVAEAIRGNPTAQQYFGQISAPSNPPKPLVLVLLISMANDKQPFSLRSAVLYCFQSYLYNNNPGKQQFTSSGGRVVEGGQDGGSDLVEPETNDQAKPNREPFGGFVGVSDLVMPAQNFCVNDLRQTMEKRSKRIVATLLPSGNETGEMTAGHVLCTGLLSNDPFLVWLCTVSLQHSLFGETSLKEQLLRVQLATSVGEPPVSLLQQVCGVLVKLGHGRGKAQVRSGILMLLSVWLSHSPTAVAHFLQDSDENIAYLTSMAGAEGSQDDNDDELIRGLCVFLLGICVLFNDDSVEKSNRSSMLQVIERRVGRDRAVECLESVSRSETYVRAAKKPYPTGKQASELLIDNEFTKLFKSLEGEVINVLGGVGPSSSHHSGGGSRTGALMMNGTTEAHDNIVASYKELIKRQDAQISELTNQLKRAQQLPAGEAAQNGDSSAQNGGGSNNSNNNNLNEEMERLKAELSEKCSMLDAKKTELEQLQQQQISASTTTADGSDAQSHQQKPQTSQIADENAQLKYQVEYYRGHMEQKQQESVYYYQLMEQWRSYQVAQYGPEAACAQLNSQLKELETQLQAGWQAYETQSTSLASALGAQAKAEHELAQVKQESSQWKACYEHEMALKAANQGQAQAQNMDHEAELGQLRVDLQTTRTELDGQKREQEDLLVLLADQDTKIREYRRRLVAVNQPVTDDDEEEEDGGVDLR